MAIKQTNPIAGRFIPRVRCEVAIGYGKEMKRVGKRLGIRLRRSHEIAHRNTVD
jgi:hypothetical protein